MQQYLHYLLLPTLLFMVYLSLFQNCPPLLSVLPLTPPLPRVHILYIFLNWLKPPQRRFSYTSSSFWFKKSKLSARIQFVHSKELSQPPRSSYFYHFEYVQFIKERIKIITVSSSPYSIVVNRNINLFYKECLLFPSMNSFSFFFFLYIVPLPLQSFAFV
jgi:hypothetical protein